MPSLSLITSNSYLISIVNNNGNCYRNFNKFIIKMKKILERSIQKQNWNDERTETVEWNEKKRVLQTNQGV